MKIAWVTPASAESAIATYSRLVVAELRRRAEVDLWAPTRKGAPNADPPDVAFADDPAVADRLAEYDVVVHNMGNYAPYHREIYRLSRRHPGVMVLHDRSLCGFFAELYETEAGGMAAYLGRVEELYGPTKALGVARVFSGGPLRWTEGEELLEISFSEQVLAGQKAAVAHSSVHAAEITRCWAGPVCAIPFPTHPELLARLATRRVDAPSEARVKLVTAGRVNANKHVHDVISVLARDRRLAERVRYQVVGTIPKGDGYRHLLSSRIREAGLADGVEVLGEQPAEQFDQVLRGADVQVNLRYPSLESGSATVSEQLASGRPLVVYDTGSFAEIPDEAALKVPVGDLDALASALWRLVGDPALRARLGEGALAEARRRSIELYVAALRGFLGSVDDWPWHAFRTAVRDQLRALGDSERLATAARVERELARVLARSSQAQAF